LGALPYTPVKDSAPLLLESAIKIRLDPLLRVGRGRDESEGTGK